MSIHAHGYLLMMIDKINEESYLQKITTPRKDIDVGTAA
jgi:hypothetical protein